MKKLLYCFFLCEAIRLIIHLLTGFSVKFRLIGLMVVSKVIPIVGIMHIMHGKLKKKH